MARTAPSRLVPIASAPSMATSLLAWYDHHGRDLPWRERTGAHSDPYAVWLSEIMLQQTTVSAVRPYFAKFRALWPTLAELAAAELDDVLKAWAGLGYYSRARNLHACARQVVAAHGGRFPDSEAALRQLPGIGTYTAAAISAIAFGRRAVVVDGNVERVMARLHAIDTPLPQAKLQMWRAMDAATPDLRSGDFAQATMDLGATICTPKSPACVICPLRPDCRGAAGGRPTDYPRKLPKKPVPRRTGAVFFVQRNDGMILLRTRARSGLFGGMTELPGTAWGEEARPPDDAALPPGVVGPLRPLGTIEHTLTHFSLTLDIFAADHNGLLSNGYRWARPEAVQTEGLPTLMLKVVAKALESKAR